MRRGTPAVLGAATIVVCLLGSNRGQAQGPIVPAAPRPGADIILTPESSPPAAGLRIPAVDLPVPAPPEPKPITVPMRPSELSLRPVPPSPAPPTTQGDLPPSAAPAVSVELVGPGTANVGQQINYELVVRNTGKSPVTQVRVDQEMPPGFRHLGSEPRCEVQGEHLVWTLPQIDAGAEKRLRVLAQSAGEGELRCRASVTFSAACSLVTRVTRPKLEVAISGPESAMVGDGVTFQIKLSNTGTGPITRLVLRGRLPAGLQHPQGSQLEADVGGLDAGQTRTVTLKTTAVKPGPQVNVITASADGTPVGSVHLAGGFGPTKDLEASATAKVNVVEPGLQIRLSGPKSCFVKCEALFTIDVSNPGTAASKNVRVTHRLPDGVDFVAASDEGVYDAAARTVSWQLLGQEPGAQRVLTVRTRGVALADGVSVVTAQADLNLSAKTDLPIRVEGVPAVSLEVSDPDDPSPTGGDAVYEIRVLNQGTCPCTGIQIIAQMPDGMALRDATAPAPYKVVGQQVQFAPFAKLATKADLVYRVRVRMTKPGDVRFRVQLTCDQLQQPVLKEESSRFYKP